MSAIAGTLPLLRTTLKQDGRSFAPWIVIATFLSASSVLVHPWVFPDQQERAGLAAAIGSNPALGLIFGPAFDLSTTDGFNAWRSLALGGFLTALGAIFAVVRSTRAQEDSGQAELLASSVLGRASRLLAGVSFAVIGSVLVGVVAAVVTGLSGGNWADSLLLGATFTATGWMFAGVAAVTAQLGSDSRAANSLAISVLGVLMILRGFAYAVDGPEWTIWVNPLGWMTETRPATGSHWWPLLLAVGLTLLLLTLAFVLQARRDFGQAMIAPRPGPATGRVRGPLQLALRLNLGPVITWIVGSLVLGFVFGYLATSINDILGSNPAVAHILASGATTQGELISAFTVTILSLVGIIATIPGVQTMVKVRTEEMEDRVEPVVAGAIHRRRYYASNVLVAFLGPALYVMIAGLVIATVASNADIGVEFGNVVLQAVATIPAVWTVVALSVAVIGARPHVAVAAWAGVLITFVLTLLGPTFKLWDWVLGISPFWHVPNVAAATPDSSGLGWISIVTVVLLAVGFAGFRKRDIAV